MYFIVSTEKDTTASRKAPSNKKGFQVQVSTFEEFEEVAGTNLNGPDLVRLHNNLAEKSVKKFSNKKTGIKRCWDLIAALPLLSLGRALKKYYRTDKSIANRRTGGFKTTLESMDEGKTLSALEILEYVRKNWKSTYPTTDVYADLSMARRAGLIEVLG